MRLRYHLFLRVFIFGLAIWLLMATPFSAHGLNLSPDFIWLKFDEYSQISWKEEEKRLDDFIRAGAGHNMSKIYVVAYAGAVSCSNEAKLRAKRVKKYLSDSGVRVKHIKTIDAGFYEEWSVSLYLAPLTAPPLTVRILNAAGGDLPINKVRVRKDCKDDFFSP